MMFVLVLTFVVVLVAWLGRRTVSPRRPLGKGRAPLRCLVILGSGGHTSEMFMALSGLSWEHYAPHYVIATTDKGSEAAMRTFEALHHPGAPPTVSFVPRAREVGQSYATSVFTTLNALMFIPAPLYMNVHVRRLFAVIQIWGLIPEQAIRLGRCVA